MSLPNHFELLGVDGQARTGRLTTPHGVVRTPAFMPVGTAGAMKGMHWREVRDAGADIVLGNTYHLMLRPGAERIAALGGLQHFTGWRGPMLTDSGGFQVMSLSELRKGHREGGDLPVAYRRRQDRTVAGAVDRGAAAARL
jgi:queuine tRNA-ribosyltransferase